MTIFKAQDVAANPSIVKGFNPEADRLVFTGVSAAEVSVIGLANGGTFFKAPHLSAFIVPTLDITQIVDSQGNGNIRFDDGSQLIIGDNSTASEDDVGNYMFGSLADDRLSGLSGNDALHGGQGDDFIQGNKGDDDLEGSDGNDTIFGGMGNDTIFGDSGDNLVNGNADNDSIIGGFGNSTLRGGKGDDTIRGDSGEDLIYGDLGDDSLRGGDSNDVLYGGDGSDQIYGSGGDDFLQGNQEGDTLYGGEGDDTILGGKDGDFIQGGMNDDSIQGNLGDDTIDGGLDADYIRGGKGDDEISGSEGDDTLVGWEGNDTLIGGTGADVFAFQYDMRNVTANEDFPEFMGMIEGISNASGAEDIVADFNKTYDVIDIIINNPATLFITGNATVLYDEDFISVFYDNVASAVQIRIDNNEEFMIVLENQAYVSATNLRELAEDQDYNIVFNGVTL